MERRFVATNCAVISTNAILDLPLLARSGLLRICDHAKPNYIDISRTTTMAHQRIFQIDPITRSDGYNAIGVALVHSAGADGRRAMLFDERA
jgi:hypothetical protein